MRYVGSVFLRNCELDSRFRGNDRECLWLYDARAKSGANVIEELQREYDELKRRANELRSFL